MPSTRSRSKSSCAQLPLLLDCPSPSHLECAHFSNKLASFANTRPTLYPAGVRITGASLSMLFQMRLPSEDSVLLLVRDSIGWEPLLPFWEPDSRSWSKPTCTSR